MKLLLHPLIFILVPFLKKISETFMTYNLLACVCCVSSDKVYIYSYMFQFCKTEVSDEKA